MNKTCAKCGKSGEVSADANGVWSMSHVNRPDEYICNDVELCAIRQRESW